MYWFATTYVILYLFHPFINKLLNNITRKEHLSLIFLMFVLFSVLGTLINSHYYGNELIQFLLFYCIGAYLAKYTNNFYKKKHNNTIIMLISFILIILSIICLDILGNYKASFGEHSRYFMSKTSPFSILFCISIFNIFTSKKEWNNVLINKIASLVFGIYLISDNRFFAIFLWNNIFDNKYLINSPLLFFHMIYSVVTIVIICLIIEFIRKKFLDECLLKCFYKKIDSLQIRIENKIDEKIG